MARFAIVILAVLFSGCAATVNTRIHPVRAVPVATPARDVPGEIAELIAWAGEDADRLCQGAGAILHGLRRDPVGQRAGNALIAVDLAWRSLERSGLPVEKWPVSPRCQSALEVYRLALDRLVEREGGRLAAGERFVLPSALGGVSVSVEFVNAAGRGAGYYDRLIPAEDISVSGFRDRILLRGMGLPVAALREPKPERAEEMERFPASGVAAPLTVAASYERGTGKAVVRLFPTLDQTAGRVDGRQVPLAADFTAPLAFSFGGANDLLLGIRNFLNVAVGTRDAGIYLAEPLDPRRVPVLLIHGLSSSPIVWRNVVNEAMGDPVIRKNFQFWYASYSTGAPIVYSASQIRDEIASLRASQPGARADDALVLVGYSMGGVVAQILVTDIGNRLWSEISPVPFDKVNFDPADYEVIRDSLFWKPVPDVEQVIFIATPHRGTRLADVSFARVANWLISLPKDFIRFQRRFIQAMGDALGGHAMVLDKLTGLDDLSSRSPLYRALEEAPFERGLEYYSIMGDRGRGDTPESSDGIVAYQSSHLDGAEAELIVPTGHDAQAYPGTEAEIRRILDLGLRHDEAGVPAGSGEK